MSDSWKKSINRRVWTSQGVSEIIPIVEKLKRALLGLGWYFERKSNRDSLVYIFRDKPKSGILGFKSIVIGGFKSNTTDGTRFIVIEIRGEVSLRSEVYREGTFTNRVAFYGLTSAVGVLICIPRVLMNIGITEIAE